ncbi:nuclear transport factor 2 family protein [Pasteurellaceae bacterium LIM206]|nr:nuclear transport factor 2 family protein [Pasteurellaceae bacterium LIM206]
MLQSTRTHHDVMATIQKYVDGANGDLDVLKQAYHKAATINTHPIENLFNSVARNGKTNATARLDYLDIHGKAASAKVVIEEWHGYRYVEYLHLLHTADGWQIVSKVFDEYQD